MWIPPPGCGLRLLLFVRRGDILLRCSDASDRVAAALLGRFLPRLGPLGFLAALFFWDLRRPARLGPDVWEHRPRSTERCGPAGVAPIAAMQRGLLFGGRPVGAQLFERNKGDAIRQGLEVGREPAE